MTHKHISRTTTIQLNALPDEVLPLFTAPGEILWVPGWNPEYVYPEDGAPKTGSIWRTQHEEHDPETVWVTINYDTEAHAVTYVAVTPNHRVTRIDIQCDTVDNDKTSAQITYTITALGEPGIEYIQQMTQAHYDHWILSWEQAINGYLAHNQATPHQG